MEKHDDGMTHSYVIQCSLTQYNNGVGLVTGQNGQPNSVQNVSWAGQCQNQCWAVGQGGD